MHLPQNNKWIVLTVLSTAIIALLLVLYTCGAHVRLGIFSKKLSTPNIIIILADDLGYGDLSCFGHPTSRTPTLDEMAHNGLVFTQFYSTSPVCSPSRASLLTGRFQTRSGVYPGVFFPDYEGGLPHKEVTIAEFLRDHGYHTGVVGKWHLGVGPKGIYLPLHHGFDEYYGVPYSHDMCPCHICFYPHEPCVRKEQCHVPYVSCPVFANNTIVEQPINLPSASSKHRGKVLEFIRRKTAEGVPFFLYYPLYHIHHPQFSGKVCTNTSIRGHVGDALKEMDEEVSAVLEAVRQAGVEDETFLFFLSDNGPSILRENEGGNAGLLKCCKGTTYEGGMRVPAIAYWRNRISPGRTTELATAMDLLPTIAKLIGHEVPAKLDGIDMSTILFDQGKGKRQAVFFYPLEPSPQTGVHAVRYQEYKAYFYTSGSHLCGDRNPDLDCRVTAKLTKHDPPLLFDLDLDPSERYNVNDTPEGQKVLQVIKQLKNELDEQMTWGESQMTNRSDQVEPCCSPGCQPFPSCCRCEAVDS